MNQSSRSFLPYDYKVETLLDISTGTQRSANVSMLKPKGKAIEGRDVV